jgi:hypothetical protein
VSDWRLESGNGLVLEVRLIVIQHRHRPRYVFEEVGDGLWSGGRHSETEGLNHHNHETTLSCGGRGMVNRATWRAFQLDKDVARRIRRIKPTNRGTGSTKRREAP